MSIVRLKSVRNRHLPWNFAVRCGSIAATLRGLTENVPSHPLAWNLGAPWSVEPRYLNLPQRDWYRQQYDQLRGRP